MLISDELAPTNLQVKNRFCEGITLALNDDVSYTVVINEEEQYSIWPTDQEIPAGWKEAGQSGSKQDCLDHIQQVWQDLRPLSLRKALGEA